MPDIYDRLQELCNQQGADKPAGLSPLELADLPDPQRQIMLYFLREARAAGGEVEHAHLQARFIALDDLPQVLDDLTRNGWLIALGEAPRLRYRLNLRHKRGSQGGLDLWNTLTDRLAGTRQS